MTGKLYLIPVSLGPGEDVAATIPEGTLEVIRNLTEFIVENTRTARRFIARTGHPVRIDDMRFHELGKHTDKQLISTYLHTAVGGKDLGLMSEAGTPCIADPGAMIVNMAREKGIAIIPLVGPNSLILALMASGFNGQNFTFHGYLPVHKKELSGKLRDLETDMRKNNRTQIFIETPFRNRQMIETILSVCNSHTKLCVAANLTMTNEHIVSKSVGQWKKSGLDFNKQPAVFLLYH